MYLYVAVAANVCNTRRGGGQGRGRGEVWYFLYLLEFNEAYPMGGSNAPHIK
jgi:hypothetical protein